MDLMILDELDLQEISGVDNPAQPTAKATIIKRAPNNVEKAADDFGNDINTKEVEMTLEEVEKKVAEAVEAKETELTKSFDAKLAEAVNAAFDAMFALDGSELDVLKAKSKEEKDDLLKLTPEERKKKLKEEKDGDEVAKFEGREIRKSAVGEDTFALYKRFEAMETEVAKAKDAEHMARLEKRADEEFKNLPGTAVEKASVLKALEGLSEEVAKSLESIMKAANAAGEEAFKTLGVEKGAAEELSAEDVKKKRDNLVNEQVEKGMKRHEALEYVAKNHKELFETK